MGNVLRKALARQCRELRCKHLRQNVLDAFVHENVMNFPEKLLFDAVGTLADLGIALRLFAIG